jgi:hypothetical protein
MLFCLNLGMDSFIGSTTGRASHIRQVKGDNPDKKGYPGPLGWGLGVKLTTSPRKKIVTKTSGGGQGPPRAIEPMMMMMDSSIRYLCVCVCGGGCFSYLCV